ncbi:MAG TPA: hypothetical protein VF801_08260, partial [Rhodocyclaceae bacterium]
MKANPNLPAGIGARLSRWLLAACTCIAAACGPSAPSGPAAPASRGADINVAGVENPVDADLFRAAERDDPA